MPITLVSPEYDEPFSKGMRIASNIVGFGFISAEILKLVLSPDSLIDGGDLIILILAALSFSLARRFNSQKLTLS
mgnify:FL=1